MARLPRNRILFLVLFTAGTFSSPLCAFGVTQEVVYKDSRPMKKLFEGTGQPGSGEAAEKAPAKYIYDPTGKTDPFKSFIVEQEVVEEKKQRKPLTYLETLDLSQLELIAIIVGPKGNFAMVRDSKGIGHVIQRGTPIGTNSGIVYAVTDKEVIVREEYKDFKGTVQHKDIAKKLPTLE
jgi:Tfp pilus assembly protein PilP